MYAAVTFGQNKQSWIKNVCLGNLCLCLVAHNVESWVCTFLIFISVFCSVQAKQDKLGEELIFIKFYKASMGTASFSIHKMHRNRAWGCRKRHPFLQNCSRGEGIPLIDPPRSDGGAGWPHGGCYLLIILPLWPPPPHDLQLPMPTRSATWYFQLWPDYARILVLKWKI